MADWLTMNWQGAIVFFRKTEFVQERPGEFWYGYDIAVTRDGSDWRFAPNMTIHVAGRNDESAHRQVKKVIKAEIVGLTLNLRDDGKQIDHDGTYKEWIAELRPRVPIPAVSARNV